MYPPHRCRIGVVGFPFKRSLYSRKDYRDERVETVPQLFPRRRGSRWRFLYASGAFRRQQEDEKRGWRGRGGDEALSRRSFVARGRFRQETLIRYASSLSLSLSL